MHKYCELRKLCPRLDCINLGDGLFMAFSFDSGYDYESIFGQIIDTITKTCSRNNVPIPHVFFSFDTCGVRESSATLCRVVEQKQRDDTGVWYMISGSLMTPLPESVDAKNYFIPSASRSQSDTHLKALIRGSICDPADHSTSEALANGASLSQFNPKREEQHIGLFHTGAYNETFEDRQDVSCVLLPKATHVIIDSDPQGLLKCQVHISQHAEPI
jgi:arginine decarboxylase